jgi:mannosyl-oligosaccharide glucosidase
MGILWKATDAPDDSLRYECNQEDQMDQFGWLRHDGRSFGQQEILDRANGVNITTQFVKDANNVASSSWLSRIDFAPYKAGELSSESSFVDVFVYAIVDCDETEVSLMYL